MAEWCNYWAYSKEEGGHGFILQIIPKDIRRASYDVKGGTAWDEGKNKWTRCFGSI